MGARTCARTHVHFYACTVYLHSTGYAARNALHTTQLRSYATIIYFNYRRQSRSGSKKSLKRLFTKVAKFCKSFYGADSENAYLSGPGEVPEGFYGTLLAAIYPPANQKAGVDGIATAEATCDNRTVIEMHKSLMKIAPVLDELGVPLPKVLIVPASYLWILVQEAPILLIRLHRGCGTAT
jgi:hypothetical protein